METPFLPPRTFPQRFSAFNLFVGSPYFDKLFQVCHPLYNRVPWRFRTTKDLCSYENGLRCESLRGHCTSGLGYTLFFLYGILKSFGLLRKKTSHTS